MPCTCRRQVGALVARQCDAYVRSRSPTYAARRLETIVRESTVAKGRLLHYFPMEEPGADGNGDEDDGVSTWCGWHNDHGSLTGLTPAMYLDEEGKELEASQLQQASFAGSGLFVLSRVGDLVQVVGVPADHLLFQIGETAEIHSGGVLQATPHAVKGGCVRSRVKRNGGPPNENNLKSPIHIQGGHAGREPRDLRRLHGARVVSACCAWWGYSFLFPSMGRN